MSRRATQGFAAVIVAALLLTLLATIPKPSAGYSSIAGASVALQPHAPIRIVGDSAFTPGNGVVSGSGLWYDPYRVEGWTINASAANGIEIRNTTAYFLLNEVRILSCSNACIDLESLSHGAVLNATLEAHTVDFVHDAVGVRAYNVSGVDLASVEVSGEGYGVYVGASSDVRIARLKVVGNPALPRYGGVVIDRSDSVTVESSVLGQLQQGISAYQSARVNVSGNRIWGSTAAVVFVESSNVAAFRNTLAWRGSGILVAESRDVVLLENVFRMYVGSLMADYAIELNRTIGARVYRNDFLNFLGYIVDDMGPENAWDGGYPAGGNWWGIEFAPDRCSGPAQDVCTGPDGIQDSPWRIDANTTDRYPFADPVARLDLPPVPLMDVTPRDGDTETAYVVNASESFDFESSWDLRYRWDWQSDGVWDTGWSADPTASHIYATPGDYRITLEVQDAGGQTDTAAAWIGVVRAPDRTGPAIVHTPLQNASVGSYLEVNATVSDPSGVANVTLFYALPDEATFHSLRMVSLTPFAYHAVIPPPSAEGVLRYYFVAADNLGNQARLPAIGTYNVSVLAAPVVGSPAVLLIAGGVAAASVAAVAAYLVLRKRRRSGPPGNP